MKLLKDLGIQQQGKRGYRFGLFLCLSCRQKVRKIKRDGLKAKFCSHRCYSKNRLKRGPYKKKIISKKYVYIYQPFHPYAIGTKKLYVAEARLVMEKFLDRFLTKNEIAHHINENTLDNRIKNLKLMSVSEHNKYHSSKKRRKKNGQFTI